MTTQHTPGPWAVYGKLVSDAKEEVGGWRCVRRVLNPKRDGRTMPVFGDCFAMVETGEDAKLVATSPEMFLILKRIVALREWGTYGTGDSHERVAADAEKIISSVEG
jgi:hypothetical protein